MISLPAQILLMSEVVGHNDLPLWGSPGGGANGHVETDDLELSGDLRARLDAWNIECVDSEDEHGFRGPDWPLHLVRQSFELAADLQLELGDECVVWCAGGGGLGQLDEQYLQQPGDSIVLLAPDAILGRDVARWLKEDNGQIHLSLLPIEALPVSFGAARAVTDWRTSINRVVHHPGAHGVPAMATVRAKGARLAGAMQAELGSRAHVFFFGGGAPMPISRGVFESLDAILSRPFV